MPRNGSGTFSLVTGNPVVSGTVIDPTVQNNTMSDVATALTNSISTNGETPIVANLPMSNFKHTGVADATARTNYASAGQAQDSSLQWLTSVAGTNTITASLTPAITAYANGQTFRFIPANTITGAATININSVGAKSLVKNQSGGYVALVANDLIAGNIYQIVYDDTGSDQFVVTNVSAHAQGADVASAATINLDTATGDYVHVTGTTNITAVTLKQGQERTLVFDGALTFTHGASLIMPGLASITTVAGDTAIVRGEASGVVRVIDYTSAGTYPYIPISGTFTGTLTGLTSGSVTTTVHYYRIGRIVALWWNAASGTSNSTALTMTGMLPADLWPANNAIDGIQIAVTNNGSNVAGNLSISGSSGSGALVFGVGVSGGTSSFTGSGTKGVLDACVVYTTTN